MKNRIIFWQNIPSIHQAPLIREVARQWSGNVLVVAEKDVPTERLKQGWSRPDFSPAELIVEPTIVIRTNLLEESPRESVHIFSGFHAYPQTYVSFKQAIEKQTSVGVFVEPVRACGLSGLIKKWRYRLHAARYGKKIDFLLPTGELGVRWYKDCGFPKEKIFPFAYFVEENAANSIKERTLDDICRLIFVGQLIGRKGFDLLLEALARCSAQGWQLDVVGEGPERSKYEKMAKTLGIESKISWLGSLPNPDVRKKMSNSDCLILPSRYDGWGAVVNEALTVGTAVLVSDTCGAADLIRNPVLGSVFPSENSVALSTELISRIEKGSLGLEERAKIWKWSRENISPQVGARYFLSIIANLSGKGLQPIVPWRDSDLNVRCEI